MISFRKLRHTYDLQLHVQTWAALLGIHNVEISGFSATQILCENSFGRFESPKTAFLTI